MSHSPAAPALWIVVIVLIFVFLLLAFIGIYFIFTLRLSSRHWRRVDSVVVQQSTRTYALRPVKEVKRPALRAVLHALAMDSPAPDRTLDAEACELTLRDCSRMLWMCIMTLCIFRCFCSAMEVMRRTLGILRRIVPPVSLSEGLVAAMQREQDQRAAALHGPPGLPSATLNKLGRLQTSSATLRL